VKDKIARQERLAFPSNLGGYRTPARLIRSQSGINFLWPRRAMFTKLRVSMHNLHKNSLTVGLFRVSCWQKPIALKSGIGATAGAQFLFLQGRFLKLRPAENPSGEGLE